MLYKRVEIKMSTNETVTLLKPLNCLSVELDIRNGHARLLSSSISEVFFLSSTWSKALKQLIKWRCRTCHEFSFSCRSSEPVNPLSSRCFPNLDITSLADGYEDWQVWKSISHRAGLEKRRESCTAHQSAEGKNITVAFLMASAHSYLTARCLHTVHGEAECWDPAGHRG